MEELNYHHIKADITLCREYIKELCNLVGSPDCSCKKTMWSIPPRSDNWDMQLSEALDELKQYREDEERGLLIRLDSNPLPCKIGDTVYRICDCADIPLQLDGTMYNSEGGYGTATGYYCPYENNCPHDIDDCYKAKGTLAIFEDQVVLITLYDTSTNVQFENTPPCDISDFGKTVFFTHEEAESVLNNLQNTIR